ncbi:MAG: serine/threonine protein kinase [Labilithrix sp.]|nr:serine/threonine protein kinase [Labilithrix sp.]
MAAVAMPTPGAVLAGKYRLVRQLGAGGMGVVYEADHVRLRQPFAVKILQPHLASERELVGRFEREARAAALLRSPHVVKVFDVDVTPDGLTYMVMELLEGRDLAAVARSGEIALAPLVDWVTQVCGAVQEAHDNGIIHRDLKPANIFVTKIETGDTIAKVLDFGISKIDAASTGLQTNRAAGALGTPAYMAPEQIRNRRIDGRADLFALGVVLYRLLGGRWPWSGEGEQRYMASVLADPAVPFERVRPDLPHELASAIMRALEKQPADRFASATDMMNALMPFGTGRAPHVPSGAQAAAPLRIASIPPPRGSGPVAIVIPATPDAVADEAGNLETVRDQPRIIAPTPVTPPSPPPVVHAQMRARRAPWLIPVAGLACALVGFGSYTALRPRASSAPAPSASVARAPEPAASSSGESIGSSIEARPAPTGVPAEPAPTSVKRKPRPAPAPSASAPEPPPGLPGHL